MKKLIGRPPQTQKSVAAKLQIHASAATAVPELPDARVPGIAQFRDGFIQRNDGAEREFAAYGEYVEWERGE